MADIFNIEGFLVSGLSTDYSTWAGTTFDPDVEFLNFGFLDDHNNNDTLTANTADRIEVGGTEYQVTSIGRPTIRIHFDDGTSYDVPNTAGVGATGFRSYYLSNGEVVIRPLDSTINDPNVQSFSNWASLEIIDATRLGSGTTMTAQDDPFVVCFAKGTRVLTVSGYRKVELLEVGDQLETQDHGQQRIRWIGKSVIDVMAAQTSSAVRPVVIQKSAIAPGLPKQDLTVSPNHRILLRNKVVERMFAEDEVLCAAKFLLGYPGISYANVTEDVEYYHILMEKHEILISEDAPSESLYLGDQTIKYLRSKEDSDTHDSMPMIERQSLTMKPARLFINRRRAQQMTKRLRNRALYVAPSVCEKSAFG